VTTGGAFSCRMKRVLKASVLAFLVAGSSASAQEANRVFLEATYLGAPTDWCPADAGVPLVVKMDGPDIIQGPKAWPRTVKVYKGGEISEFVTGEHTDSFKRPEDFEDSSAKVIGRFSAEFRTCHSAWASPRPTGSWRLTAPDGRQLSSGMFEEYLFSYLYPPFFRPVGGASKANFADFGDQLFFTEGPLKTNITQTFAATPDKEQ
jgi:hypothetical protein